MGLLKVAGTVAAWKGFLEVEPLAWEFWSRLFLGAAVVAATEEEAAREPGSDTGLTVAPPNTEDSSRLNKSNHYILESSTLVLMRRATQPKSVPSCGVLGGGGGEGTGQGLALDGLGGGVASVGS